MSTLPVSTSPAFLENASRGSEPLSPFLQSNLLTYQALIDEHLRRRREELERIGASPQGVSNDRNTINRWMEAHGRTPSSLVDDDFSSEYRDRLKHFVERLEQEGRASQYISDHKSRLRRWQESWLILSRTAGLPLTFGEALQVLIKDAGTTIRGLARHFGRCGADLRYWVNGRCYPSAKSLAFVSELEDYFGVPKNTLLSRLPSQAWGSYHKVVPGLTRWRQKCMSANRLHYYLAKFPPSLEKEWQNMYTFFRSDSYRHVAEGKKRNIPWRVRAKDGKCPTAESRKDMFAAFFGALCLPEESPLLFPIEEEEDREKRAWRGKVFDADSLTFGLITDFNLIMWYVEFRKFRAGMHTTSTLDFLEFCGTILHPETGYLKQSIEYGQKLGSKTESEWFERCAEGRKKIIDLIRSIKQGEGFQSPRDSFEPIQNLIDLDHPVSALKKFANDVEADAPPDHCSPGIKALHARDVFLIRLLTANPLRIGQIVTMTYCTDDTGNLYRKADGSWHLRFLASDFKNEKGLVNDLPYDVPLPPSLWKDIENYLFVHRPHLLGAETCDYVFRPGGRGLKKKIQGVTGEARLNLPLHPYALSGRLTLLSQHYIEDCPGFGAHAFRHLVATEYVKNHENGFEIAAGILHDAVETVRKVYTRFRSADKFKNWNHYLETLEADASATTDREQTRRTLLEKLEILVRQLGAVFSPEEVRAALRAMIRLEGTS